MSEYEEVYKRYEKGETLKLSEAQFKYCFDKVKQKQDLKELSNLMMMYTPEEQEDADV